MPTRPRLFLLLFLLAGRLWAAGCDDPGVRIVEERQGNVVHLFAETTNCLDVTITLRSDLHNMQASASLPVTLDTNGQSRVELVRLQPVDASQPWHYTWTYRWRYGGRGGQPDDTVYQLPFAAGERHRLMQGYRGGFSHQRGSPNEYAHDWVMPEGSAVLAARAGTVVGIRQDATAGGPGEQYTECANYVIIRHADGTYAEYLHLQPHGVRVQLRQAVTAGQLLALSGNTGRTTRPHLHFAVFRALDGDTRESLPVKFRLKDGSVQSPQPGRTY